MDYLLRCVWVVGNALCAAALLLVTWAIVPLKKDHLTALLAYESNTQAGKIAKPAVAHAIQAAFSTDELLRAGSSELVSPNARSWSSIVEAPALQENFAFLSIGPDSLPRPFAIQLSSHAFATTVPAKAAVLEEKSTTLLTRVSRNLQTGSTVEREMPFIRADETKGSVLGLNPLDLNHRIRSHLIFPLAADPHERPKLLNEFAFNYWRQQRYKKAEFLFRSSLHIQQELGFETELAGTLDSLGMLMSEQNRHGAAEAYFWRSLIVRERLLGPFHPETARSLHNLAWQYTKGGYYSDAEPLYRRAHRIVEKELGPDHLALADLLNNLAWLWTKQSRYNEAQPLYARSLSIKERALGVNHPDVALSLNNLAAVYHRQGRSARAAQLLERALAICASSEHPCLASLFKSLAMLSVAQDRYDQAVALLHRALTTARRSPGSELRSAILLLNTIAEICNVQGRLAEAELVLRRAVLLAPVGAAGVEIADSLNILAVLYLKLGRSTEAEPLTRRSLAVLREVAGPSHVALSKPLNTLALLARKSGRDSEAERLFNRSIELAGNSAVGAAAMAHLADLYMDQGQLSRASQLRIGSATVVTIQEMRE